MINEIVTEKEWHNIFPEVDQEYVWQYPLFRGQSEEGKNLFVAQNMPLTNNLGIYIHVPFCLYRCPMCGFYVEKVNDRSFSQKYADALVKEIKTYEKYFDFSQKKLKAIYFGGGTASLLEARDIERLINSIKKVIKQHTYVEITVENHPSVATSEYLHNLKEIGINRVSFGIQSFFNEDLKILGLIQREYQNKFILQEALELNFSSVAADLIYAIPNQTIEHFLSNVKYLVSMGVHTVSLYCMGLSERQKNLQSLMPDQNTEKEMFFKSMHYLLDSGYIHMAQPDFCLPGHTNFDNEITWKAPQGEQIALGAGGFSYFNDYIYCNTHNSKKYMEDVDKKGFSIQYIQKITLDDQMSRYMVLGVRCFYISDKYFKKYFGISFFDIYGQEIRLLQSQGLVCIKEENGEKGLLITEKGKYYVDNISKTFYSPANRCRLQPYCYDIGKEWRI